MGAIAGEGPVAVTGEEGREALRAALQVTAAIDRARAALLDDETPRA